MTVDPSTHESEGFQVKGGDVTLPSSMNGYKVVNTQGQAVSTLEPGETYHVVFEPSTDPTKINMLCPYLHVATADYYHSNEAEGTMTYGPDKGQKKPWQNMVGLETNMASLNIKFAKSSSQSSSLSSESSSSSVKSSSAVSSSKSSSSSVKSSSVVSSSQKNTSSTKQAVVVGVHNNTNSGKGTGHGQGEGHGMPQTGEAVATSLIAAGVVLLAAAGVITLRKRN